MSKKDRMVMALHKRDASGALAVGQTFMFPGSGDRYTVQSDGSVRGHRVKLSKAEKKAARREKVRQLKLSQDHKA